MCGLVKEAGEDIVETDRGEKRDVRSDDRVVGWRVQLRYDGEGEEWTVDDGVDDRVKEDLDREE